MFCYNIQGRVSTPVGVNSTANAKYVPDFTTPPECCGCPSE